MMAGPVPERTMDMPCGRPISGPGVMSFHCTLSQGHRGTPAEDPEPCYAVEIDRSVRAWQAWRGRQDHQGRASRGYDGTRHPGCPGAGVLRVDLATGQVTCTGCDVAGRVVPERAGAESDVPEPGHPGQDPDLAAAFSAAGRPRGAPITETHADAATSFPTWRPEKRPVSAEPDRSSSTPPPYDREAMPAPALAARSEAEVSTPDRPPAPQLRQRPGDQPLPTSRDDHPGTHHEVIEDLLARRELGLGRYGSLLQPHNGRSFLRDAYEESLDQAVYLRGLLDEVEAGREDLVEVAERVLSTSRTSGRFLAEHVVEALLESVALRWSP